MINTNYNSSFPSQVVSNAEKASMEYGASVAQAIESEWFGSTRRANNRFVSNLNNFHKLRLYARGEQPIQKYKDELSINGDLSYLNLDWKPVPVIAKFVDIVVNGISNKSYEIKAYAQDPESLKKKTDYVDRILSDMQTKDHLANVKSTLGIDLFNVEDPDALPRNEEELSLYMQLEFKQNVEIAEEEVINNLLDKNKYTLTSRRINYDLVTLGIAATKTSFNKAEGVVVDYVDPANMVYSYTEDPNFEDVYYVGEVKDVSFSDLKKQFPELTAEDLKEIEKYPGNKNHNYSGSSYSGDTVTLMYFEYKTYLDQVFKIKNNSSRFGKSY